MTITEDAVISELLPHARPEDRWIIDTILNQAGYRRALDIRPGDVLLDLGAHVGACVAFALQEGAEHVVAVEMLPATVDILRRHFATDPRVTIVPAAVAAESRNGTAVTRRFSNPMGASISEWNAHARNGVTVPTVTLAGLLAGYQPTKLKIDIENAEYEILGINGIDALTASPVQRVAAELHIANRDTVAEARRVISMMRVAGWTSSRDTEAEPYAGPTKPSGWHMRIAWHR